MELARPLAGLPPADPQVLARAWLLRRIAAAPLAAAGALASDAFAERAPSLAGSLLAALGDDGALAALPAAADTLRGLVVDPPGVHRGLVGDPPGTHRGLAVPGRDPRGADFPPTPTPAAALATAAEQLRGATLEVLLPRTDAALQAALHDRLARACAELLQAALAEAIIVHDARAPADPRAHLTAEAERLVVARTPFALLAVEVEDAAIVPASILAAAEAALRQALPSGTCHAPDGPGSLLVLVPGAEGHTVARALTTAVASAASHHGAPLRAAAGVAEHPRDGDTPEGLLAHADGQLFAARAEGLPLA